MVESLEVVVEFRYPVVVESVALVRVASSVMVEVVVFHLDHLLDQDVGRARWDLVLVELISWDSVVFVEASLEAELVVDVSSAVKVVLVTGPSEAEEVAEVVDDWPSLLQLGSVESSRAINGLLGLSIGLSRLSSRLQLPAACRVGSKTTPTQKPGSRWFEF
jgi:hypothetical protein